jgi:non-canonical (house-cleaning) NTP pyrophosphatase
MTSLRVAVGSLRAPKVNAVRKALDSCSRWLAAPHSQIEIVGFEVESGVGATPLSRLETMRGARQRVDVLRRLADASVENWDYFVGLEGGLEVVNVDGARRVFLESWVYAANSSGVGNYGQAGAIALPDDLAARVVDDRIDLSAAIDAFAGASGIRNSQGAWGVLTCGLITREDAFWTATINAFAPFFLNRESRQTGG